MSILTTDDETYREIRLDAYIRYVRHGMTGPEAAQRAQELMDAAFKSADVEEQEIVERDRHSPDADIWWPT